MGSTRNDEGPSCGIFLIRKRDDENEVYVATERVQKNGKPLLFGAVQMTKRYVSFHLMPVYMKPELLGEISPSLRNRMQGKACINFNESNTLLFKELKALTEEGYASCKKQGFFLVTGRLA